MAKQLTDVELAWANLVKAIRSQVRLKHSLAADRELNRLIPKIETQFMKAVKAGETREFVLAAVSEVANAAS